MRLLQTLFSTLFHRQFNIAEVPARKLWFVSICSPDPNISKLRLGGVLLVGLALSFTSKLCLCQGIETPEWRGTDSSVVRRMERVPNLLFDRYKRPFFTRKRTTVSTHLAHDQRMTEQTQDDGKIALFLAYRHPRFTVLEQSLVLKLIIWEDGRVIYGQSPQETGSNGNHFPGIRVEDLRYLFGKTDSKNAKRFIREVLASFHLDRQGGTISYLASLAPSGFWMLRGSVDGKVGTVLIGMVNFDDAISDDRAILARIDGTYIELQTTDGQTFTSSQLYDAWKKLENDISNWGESAVKKPPVLVKVIMNKMNMVVLDESGSVLIRAVPCVPLQ